MSYLFFDIDGTLINSPYESDISASTLEVLKEAKKNGHKLFLCSGRGYTGCQYLMKHGVFDGIIFSDGAGVFAQDKIVLTSPIDNVVLKKTMETISNDLHGYVMLSGLYKTFIPKIELEKGSEWLEEKDGRFYMQDIPVYTLEEYDDSPILEFDVMFPSDAYEKEFSKQLDSSLNYISTSASYGRGEQTSGEVTNKGITKGSGVKVVLEVYQDLEGVTYGFGDSMNDAPLLEQCTYSIAMGNACEELKKIAGYITDDIDKSGLQKALEFYDLIGTKFQK